MEKRRNTRDLSNDLTPKDIAGYLNKIRFRKKLFGGVNEFDVWKKLKKIDEMYSSALEQNRIKYETLLAEHGIQLESVEAKTENGGADEVVDGKE